MTPDDLVTHTSPQVIEYLKELESRVSSLEKPANNEDLHPQEDGV